MMTILKRKIGVTGLLMLFIFLSGCRDKGAEPVIEKQAVTVAFKVPARVGKNTVSTNSGEKRSAASEEPKGEKEKTPVAIKKPSDEIAAAVSETPEYTGDGKVDPFMPLIKNEPVRVKEPDRPLTPLERLDYSQMKLVAIVSRGVQRVAMVEENGGKGYIVLVGTYIGRNGGVVSEIRKDRVIVHELRKDFKGDMITHTQEIKLNKTEDKEV